MVYIVLAPHNNEQSDLIHRINEDKQLIEVPEYRYDIKYDDVTHATVTS